MSVIATNSFTDFNQQLKLLIWEIEQNRTPQVPNAYKLIFTVPWEVNVTNSRHNTGQGRINPLAARSHISFPQVSGLKVSRYVNACICVYILYIVYIHRETHIYIFMHKNCHSPFLQKKGTWRRNLYAEKKMFLMNKTAVGKKLIAKAAFRGGWKRKYHVLALKWILNLSGCGFHTSLILLW